MYGVKFTGAHWITFDESGDRPAKFIDSDSARHGGFITDEQAQQININEQRLINKQDTLWAMRFHQQVILTNNKISELELSNDKIKLALRVMSIFNSFNGLDCDEVWWRTDGRYAPVTMIINCNDLFYWAASDAESITSENIADLEKAIQEIRDIDDTELNIALLLWVCRNRKMRPQTPYYKHIPTKFHHLFNEAGPERSV